MLNPFPPREGGVEGGLLVTLGRGVLGRVGRGGSRRGACRGGASPGERLALLEFLVGGQDQRQICFCRRGKRSAA